MASIWDKLTNRSGKEQRSITTNEIVNISDSEGMMRLLGLEKINIPVTPANALSVSAFYGCLRVLSNHFAMLPRNVYKKTQKSGKTILEVNENHPLQTILRVETNRLMTPFDWYRVMILNKKVYGYGISKIIRKANGQIDSFKHYASNKVTIYKLDDALWYQPEGYAEEGFWDYDAIHTKELDLVGEAGTSIVKLAKNTIQVNLTAKEFLKKYFQNGTFVSGVIEYPQGVGKPKDEKSDDMRTSFVRGLKGDDFGGFGLGFLFNGGKFNSVSKTPIESQLQEFFKKSDVEIYQLLGVPPIMVGDTEKSTSFGQGVEQQYLMYLNNCLQPEITQLEQEIKRKCLKNEVGTYVKTNVNALLRTDSAGRAALYDSLSKNAAISPNEIRMLEEMNPYDEGDEHWINGAYMPISMMKDVVAQKYLQDNAGKTTNTGQ